MKIPTTVKAVKPVHPILAAFRELSVDPMQSNIRNLAGNYDSDILFLCEPLTETEYSNKCPMSDPEAHRVYLNVLQQAGFDVLRDTLVLPFQRFGTKPKKENTDGISTLVTRIFKGGEFKVCVCMGMLPFAYTFAGGRKTHARSMIGNLMFLPQLSGKPVFVLPSSDGLIPKDGSWREANYAKECAARLHSSALKFKELLKSRIK